MEPLEAKEMRIAIVGEIVIGDMDDLIRTMRQQYDSVVTANFDGPGRFEITVPTVQYRPQMRDIVREWAKRHQIAIYKLK